MPWYRIFASHGPGHQSSSEHYRWFEKELDKQGKEDAWEEIFANERYDWPIGDVEQVRGLPAHILEGKMSGCRSEIAHASKMLGVLQNTPIIPVIAVRLEFDHSSGKPESFYEARFYLPEAEGRGRGKTRELAARNLVRQRNAAIRQRSAAKNARKMSVKDFAVIVR